MKTSLIYKDKRIEALNKEIVEQQELKSRISNQDPLKTGNSLENILLNQTVPNIKS